MTGAEPTPVLPAIVVDGVFFQIADSGIARLWYEVLGRWQETEFGRRVLVLDRDGSLPRFDKLRTHRCPPLDYAHWQDDRKMLQEVCDQTGAGLFMSTYYTRPERTPSALLLYDMIPERLGFDLNEPMWRQKHDAIVHAAAFGAISQSTLSDLREFFPQTGDRPAVLALPAVNRGFTPPSDAERALFHEKFVVPALDGRPYLMYVGEHNFYKNPGLLFDALQSLPAPVLGSIGLLLTHDGLAEGFGRLPGLKIYAGRLSDGGLRQAYGSAQALIYPSLYEGFGLPALEAMACGCPVICSNTSSIPEVVGDAALLMDPRDASQLRAHILSVQRPEMRADLRRKGLERVTHFSWDRMAETLADLARTTCDAHLSRRQGQSPYQGQ